MRINKKEASRRAATNVEDYRLTKAVINRLEPGMLLHNSSGRSFRQVIVIDHDRCEVVVRIERGKKVPLTR